MLSGRDHKDRRDIIRETWAQEAEANNVAVRFVVGAHGCPESEKTEWGCKVDTPDPGDEPSKILSEAPPAPPNPEPPPASPGCCRALEGCRRLPLTLACPPGPAKGVRGAQGHGVD